MQQATYNTIRTPNNTAALDTANTARATRLTLETTVAARPSRLARWVACRWDIVGVLTLMAASAAYAVAALAHLGL